MDLARVGIGHPQPALEVVSKYWHSLLVSRPHLQSQAPLSLVPPAHQHHVHLGTRTRRSGA